MKYQKKTGMSLFEQENMMESLSKMGNPLVLLKEIVDFEQFRDELEKLFTNDSKKNNAGRKPIDPVFMLKVLFLQRSRNGEGDILHRIHKSGLQYVQIGSDKEVSSRLDYELNNR